MILKTHKKGLAQNGKHGGFTLIELLIVIAIIAILAGLVAYSLEIARQKAKNSTVKTDITQLMQAMEVVKVDSTPFPANSAINDTSTSWTPTTPSTCGSGTLRAQLCASFPDKLPVQGQGGHYNYQTNSSDKTKYSFWGDLIVAEGTDTLYYGRNGSTGAAPASPLPTP